MTPCLSRIVQANSSSQAFIVPILLSSYMLYKYTTCLYLNMVPNSFTRNKYTVLDNNVLTIRWLLFMRYLYNIAEIAVTKIKFYTYRNMFLAM